MKWFELFSLGFLDFSKLKKSEESVSSLILKIFPKFWDHFWPKTPQNWAKMSMFRGDTPLIFFQSHLFLFVLASINRLQHCVKFEDERVSGSLFMTPQKCKKGVFSYKLVPKITI